MAATLYCEVPHCSLISALTEAYDDEKDAAPPEIRDHRQHTGADVAPEKTAVHSPSSHRYPAPSAPLKARGVSPARPIPCTATQRTTPASKTGRVIENPTCGRHAGRRLAQPRPHWTARPEHYDDTSPLASCRFHLIVAVAEGPRLFAVALPVGFGTARLAATMSADLTRRRGPGSSLSTPSTHLTRLPARIWGRLGTFSRNGPIVRHGGRVCFPISASADTSRSHC
ncbi:hypothetical protein CSOJ01_10879 [Colletotrichum sojae]|uniref:Uncharacterized protein n=1 Tax=Colletotrichum sojae TaxID=2175907 RepID=A0A8H6MNM4_9PEZI|nr:hypothetical protein CSOJ01_10879 [Colletotrichum sojae]